MCKIAAFFEGGMAYETLCDMPLSEFFKIVDCANEIDRKRQEKINRGK